MHISDGVLPTELLVGGYIVATVGVSASLRSFDESRAPALGVITSLFFAASSLKIPLPPASVHLILNGLLGVVLGPLAWPCIAVALFFQFLAMGHGGLTTLGVNVVILGSGATAAHLLFHAATRGRSARWLWGAAFLGGSASVVISSVLVWLVLYTASVELVTAGWIIVAPHLVTALLEGLLSASAVVFILKVKPELLRWKSPIQNTGIS